jgi:hypothetical protein
VISSWSSWHNAAPLQSIMQPIYHLSTCPVLPSHLFNRSSPIDHDLTISSAKSTRSTVFLVVHESRLPQFENFVAGFPFLNEFKKDLLGLGSKYLFVKKDSNGKLFVIIRASDYETVSHYIEVLKTCQTVPQGSPFLE